MSITQWASGELFTVRVYKRIIGRPDLLWANSYELAVAAANTDGETAAVQVATSLAIWESQFHLTDVQFDRAVFSTLVPDSVPYEPDNFVSVGLTSITGEKAPGDQEPAGLTDTLLVRRVVGFGRNGRMLYRRALTEGEITAPAGTKVLTPAARTLLNSRIQGGWDGGAESPGILELLREVYGVNMVMVGTPPAAPNVRLVRELDATGVTTKSLNNAFYNRRTPSGPPINP